MSRRVEALSTPRRRLQSVNEGKAMVVHGEQRAFKRRVRVCHAMGGGSSTDTLTRAV